MLSRVPSKGTFPQLVAVNVLKSETIVKFKNCSFLPHARVAQRQATCADCYLLSSVPCNNAFPLFHLRLSLGVIIVNNSFLGPRERGDAFLAWHYHQRGISLPLSWRNIIEVVESNGGNKRIPMLCWTPPTASAIYIVTEPNLGRKYRSASIDAGCCRCIYVCMRVNISRI